jgi:hypothetical protein
MRKYLLIYIAVIEIIFINSSFSMLDLIDIPTTEVNERYEMELNFRLYSNGGVVSRINFGVFQRLTIGCSLDIYSLIGTDTPIVRQPSLYLKLRIFDGTKKLPSIALGFDGQGYRYDDKTGSYQHKERGLFIVFNTEILTKHLELNSGVNANSSKEENKNVTNFYGFIGLSYPIQKNERKILCFMAELDNLFSDYLKNRYNIGVKIFPTENFNIDLVLKDIFSPNNLTIERLIKVAYQTQF